MSRVAVFPGSFDPITIGHADIINRALPLFDKLIIGIGVNSQKKYLFPVEKRLEWFKRMYEFENKIEIESYTGLTVDFCERKNANYILRGLRTSADFQFERSIAQMNQSMNRNIETVFILTNPSLAAVNSSIVRDIFINGGDISQFVPEEIEKLLH